MKSLLLFLLCAGTLQAGLQYSFESISINSPADAAIGTRQLSMTVTESDDRVSFNFFNRGPDAAVIGTIYFYGGSLLESPRVDDTWPGVDFADADQKVSPAHLPGFEPTAGHLAAFAAFGARKPAPVNGVGPGERLTVEFALTPGAVFADLADRLARGEMVIGMHVQAFDDGFSESFVSRLVPDAIPEPATLALLGMGGLAMLKLPRRRE